MKASLIACRLFVAGNPVSFGPPESYIYWSNDSWQGYPCPIGRRTKAWLSTVHVSSAAGMNNRIAPNAHFPRVLRRSIDCGTHMCGSIPHHKHVTPGRQGRNEGEQGGHNPQTPNHYGGAEWLRGTQKIPNHVWRTFFNTVNLLPKDVSFEHGDAKLASFPGRL